MHAPPGLEALPILNVLLGIACLGAVLAVGIAAWLDWREARSLRALVPPCWPPPGVDPRDAYAEDLVAPGRKGHSCRRPGRCHEVEGGER